MPKQGEVNDLGLLLCKSYAAHDFKVARCRCLSLALGARLWV